MEQGLLANLPREIGIDIFSRLPFKTIMKCKCVCKAWRHLLSTREFVDYHYSTKSVPGLIISKGAARASSKGYKILEFVDFRRHPCKMVCGFSFPRSATLHSSANGLLLFSKRKDDNLLVCNPMTREYINLPPFPTQSPAFRRYYYCYGFGVSKVSGEYKVVRVSTNSSSYKFEVYTLGTGSWRSLALGGNALPHFSGVFVDGKLYSLVKESCMSCFDLETELFSTVSCPSSRGYMRHLCVLGDRLSLCLNDYDEVVIWVMHEVGQWRKEFVICKAKMHEYRWSTFSAIKVLGEGKILLVREGEGELYYYSRKSKTIEPISVTRNSRNSYRVGYRYTPSFLPLKTFAIENVCSF